jgi:signal peptidase I
MITLLIVGLFFLGSLLLSAIFLWLGARLLKAGKATFFRALGATMTMVLAGIAIVAGAGWFHDRLNTQDIVVLNLATWAVVGAQLLLSWLIICFFLQTTLFRAILAWLGSLLAGVVAAGMIVFLIRPYVFEAFVVTTNSMAPTVLGFHQEKTCPHCGGLLIVPVPPPEDLVQFGFARDEVSICSDCQKTAVVENDKSTIRTPDRIMADKLLEPRRWDMIVFRPPMPLHAGEWFVMRLVGLPGEKVYIKDGAVWVNDGKMDLPAELAGLRYVTELPGGTELEHVTPNNPLRLGPDEYCVLGDFSGRSNDSRSWGPLSGDSIKGVITVRYWPFSRCKIFR